MQWFLSHLALNFAAFVLLAPLVYGLHESDVGVVDWHKLLIGVPLVGAPVTAPTFRTIDLNPGTKDGRDQSVIYTATGNNVFAALNPRDGSVVWRHIFEPEDRIAGFYAYRNSVATLSGPGGATLRIFDAVAGVISLEKRLHAPEMGHLAEPHHLGTHAVFGNDGETYVLTDGHVVRRMNVATGGVQWTWAAEDQTALTMHTHLLTTPTALYVVGLSKSLKSFTLHVTALDLNTGTVLSTRGVPSSIQHLDAYVLLSNTTRSASEITAPHVAWLENGGLQSFELTPKLNLKPTAVLFRLKTKSNVAYERLIDTGIANIGYALAIAGDGYATLLGLNDGKVEGVGAFQATVRQDSGAKADAEDREDDGDVDSVWVGSIGKNDGEVMLGRLFWSPVSSKIKLETLLCTRTGSMFPSLESGVFEVEFNTLSHGVIAHATLAHTHESSSPSLLLTTSTGSFQLWDLSSTEKEKWNREEALATIVVAEFVELSEGPTEGAGSASRRDRENFFARVWRHVGDTKNLPQYLSAFIRRFLTGSYASPTSLPVPASPLSASSSQAGIPIRDAFGFRQIIVAATAQGKVFGVDSSNGRVIWSRVLSLGWAAEVGANIIPVKMFVLGPDDIAFEDDDQVERGPQVVLVAQRRAENTLVDTVIFHIDALTGADASSIALADPELQLGDGFDSLLQGIDIIPGPLIEAFLLPPPSYNSPTQNLAKAVLLLDEYLQVYLYPSTPRTRATLQALRQSLHFPLRTNTPDGTRVVGHSIGPHIDASVGMETEEWERGFVAHPTWTLNLPLGEDVKAMLPAKRGPVASLGKVLGNRTTLYKYLNPRMFVLLTAPRSAAAVAREDRDANPEGWGQTCGVYVVDAAKGNLIYRMGLPVTTGKDGKDREVGKEACDVKASLVENWLIYHYYDPDWAGPGLTKGWRIVSVELYEGKGLDEKTKSSDMSSYSNENVNVMTFERSYVFPHPVTALTTTSTKFGMTSKDIIVANRAHQIQSIQHRLLDPRRPNRKVTAEEQEEFLVTYDPILAYDPRRVLSHHYEVANIQRIITSPALLESTSLVFAYGLDLFLTRVAPSNTFDVLNENFNKAQLVLIVGGLALAIVFTKPMVRRKTLKEKWYSSK